ncbi:zinc-finger domain-containing protein [Paenibacillus xylanexedens]|uniref:zinc-finger domain-containing protein n=1 Tax=Paenibacillus xylanexedens TaxID=528191 RepID=UPI000F51B1F7|nr:zinc-finger domain-containing protein [Paenibacillus xylanexedens]RPK29843.1 hypothetical protein EDO6_00467 [Paenibacillus xylanexedens]
MRLVSQWQKMKGIAAANNVPYTTYIRRLHEGQTPEEAASKKPLIRHATENTVKRPKAKPKPKPKGPKNPMGREKALKKIDEVMDEHCKPCGLRNRLDSYCLLKCKVGKDIQELGKHLTVNPRKSVTEANRR